MTDMSQSQPADDAQAISQARAYYILGVLLFVSMFNFIDRQVLTILIDPIKSDLGVSDTAMGFLTGLAFAVFYALAAIPISRYADRGNRRNLIALSVGVWSVMTVASGMATSYIQLAITRIGVAAGEAGAGPAIPSIVSDLFPLRRRATALAIVSSGATLGILFGLMLGGILNEWYSWRTAFIIVGAPGIILALIFRFTVPEPKRGQADGIVVPPSDQTMGQVVRHVLGRPTLLLVMTSMAAHSLTSYAYMGWTPTFMIRVHEMSTSQVGIWIGLTMGGGLFIGNLAAGIIADKLGAKDIRWYLWIPAIGNFLSLPAAIYFLMAGDPTFALIAFVPLMIFISTWSSPTSALVMTIVPANTRAFASAILGMLNNLVGMGLGPLFVGILNDMFAPEFGADAVRYSLLIMSGGFLASGVFFMISAQSLKKEQAQNPLPGQKVSA